MLFLSFVRASAINLDGRIGRMAEHIKSDRENGRENPGPANSPKIGGKNFPLFSFDFSRQYGAPVRYHIKCK